KELTQPQGHSTSGSHERYKDENRLAWEAEFDCNVKLREWMIANGMATDEELKEIETTIKKEVRDGKKAAWTAFIQPLKQEQQELLDILEQVA
ncbi:MAG TPA: transketolase, partial [Xanthomarina gelatinilytica]|nr:transketolase [Xanthomarina gelatinilytica]